MKNRALAIAILALVGAAASHAGNIVTNGDFSSGNADFTSDYTYIPYDYSDYTATPTVGPDNDYTVGPLVPPSYSDWAPFNTVSGGSTQMLVGNGAEDATESVWAQGETVSPNTTYAISFYVAEISNPASNADIAVNLGGTQIGDGVAVGYDNWTQYSFNWNSGSNTSINLALKDLNTSGVYNDFAIDNISMAATPEPSSFLALALPLPLLLRRRSRR